jgi:hypothetical protein
VKKASDSSGAMVFTCQRVYEMDGEHHLRALRAEIESFLARPAAPDYVRKKWGFIVAESTLAKYASTGGGPIFEKFNGRVYYSAANLDRWVAEKRSGPRRSTSEADSSGGADRS